jgi:hypothetical protein
MFEQPLDPPEAKPFSGYVTFACVINDATVEVRAHVNDDELDFDTAQVWYCNTEVSALLADEQFTSIQAQFDADYHNIVTFDVEMA